MKNLQSFEEFLNEAIKTKEIDPSRFPDPGVKNDRAFFIKGKFRWPNRFEYYIISFDVVVTIFWIFQEF